MSHGAIPVRGEVGASGGSPGGDDSLSRQGQGATEDRTVVDAYGGGRAAVRRVEVGRWVVESVHRDDDSGELADPWHPHDGTDGV